MTASTSQHLLAAGRAAQAEYGRHFVPTALLQFSKFDDRYTHREFLAQLIQNRSDIDYLIQHFIICMRSVFLVHTLRSTVQIREAFEIAE